MEVLSWAGENFDMPAAYWLIVVLVVGIFVVGALWQWRDQRSWTRRGRLDA